MMNIDTYEAVKNLTAAKFTKTQAQAVVKILAEAEGEVFSKKDGELLETKIDSRVSSLEKRLEVKIAALETRLLWKIIVANGLLFAALRLTGGA